MVRKRQWMLGKSLASVFEPYLLKRLSAYLFIPSSRSIGRVAV